MAEAFQSKVDSGEARKASSGFSGKGFTFDDSEQSESQQVSEPVAAAGQTHAQQQGVSSDAIIPHTCREFRTVLKYVTTT